MAILILIAAGLFFWHRAAAAWNEQAELTPHYGIRTDKKVGSFVCNVYWGTEYLEPILDILKENHIHATFFIGGSWAKDNPELLSLIAAQGHEIGSHGYSHKMHSQLSLEQNIEEMEKADQMIREITGCEIRLFMPPSGDFSSVTLQAAKQLGYETVMWTADTIDWRDQDPEVLIERVKKRMEPGGIILTHPTAATVEAYPQIIDALHGYQWETVGELLEEETTLR